MSALPRLHRCHGLDPRVTPGFALGNCGQVFLYAIATGRAKRDPSVDLRGALHAGEDRAFCRDNRAQAGWAR